MHPDVSALLDVQTDDLHLYSIEDRLGALAPRLAALEKDRLKADGMLADTRAQVEAEEHRQRDVQDRLRQHRDLRDKSENLLGQVSSPREAAAAMAQIEQAKRFIADEERDIETIGQRLTELRGLAADRERALNDIGQLQQETRTTLESDRVALETELAEARAVRDEKARKVPRALMQRYDRIRQKRRSTALYALRGLSCANCDTVLPVQRRSTMVGTGGTELCEGCGVLLYAAE